jgi:hypothetical protein
VGKKLVRPPPISIQKLEMWGETAIPATLGTYIEGSGKNVRPYLKNNKSKIELGAWLA